MENITSLAPARIARGVDKVVRAQREMFVDLEKLASVLSSIESTLVQLRRDTASQVKVDQDLDAVAAESQEVTILG